MLNKTASLILLIIISLINANSDECLKEQSKHITYYINRRAKENFTHTALVNFDQFNDLIILGCNKSYSITKYLSVWPSKQIVIDRSFQLNKIINQSQLNLIENLYLRNLKGIDLNSQSFILDINRLRQPVIVDIFYSTLNVYSDSKRVEKCDAETYNLTSTTTFAQYFFGIRIYNSLYPRVWCPYFFKNFDLGHLILQDITNSFLFQNRLNFYQINSSSKALLTKLNSLQFYLTYESLSVKNLSPLLFQNIKSVGLGGILNGIQTNLFKDLGYLRSIELAISNLKEFFHFGNKWMIYLNVNVSYTGQFRINSKQTLRLKFRRLNEATSFNSIYEYPNEDLCLFKHFPHERLVYPIVVPGKKLQCTCTLYWLQLNLSRYENEIKPTTDYTLNYNDESKIYESKEVYKFCNDSFGCDYKSRLLLCQISSEVLVETHRFNFDNDDDIFYAIKLVQFVLLVILQPIFCLIGVVNNSLTILVIMNKNKNKEFQEPMYKHIIINAVFNIAYCLITSLKLLNTCLFYGSSLFCSNVYQEVWAQNLKIYLIYFLGNAAKMCSNFSYLIFSISRMLLITQQKALGKKIKKMYILIYFLALIVIACLLSSFKMFQYEANNLSYMRKEFPFEIRDELYCMDKTNKLQCGLFNVFKIVNRSINDVLFVILNICIDLVLLAKFKKHMERKIRQINDLAQHRLIEKSKKNVNRMIFCNSLIYILSHLPEFTMTLLLVVFAKSLSNFCNYKNSCDLLNDEAEFFNLISIVCQFYVFKIFDKNFKISLSDLKANLRHFIFKSKKSNNLNLAQEGNFELKNLNNLIGNGLLD